MQKRKNGGHINFIPVFNGLLWLFYNCVKRPDFVLSDYSLENNAIIMKRVRLKSLYVAVGIGLVSACGADTRSAEKPTAISSSENRTKALLAEKTEVTVICPSTTFTVRGVPSHRQSYFCHDLASGKVSFYGVVNRFAVLKLAVSTDPSAHALNISVTCKLGYAASLRSGAPHDAVGCREDLTGKFYAEVQEMGFSVAILSNDEPSLRKIGLVFRGIPNNSPHP